MTLPRKFFVDGEDVDIEDLSDLGLKTAVTHTEADIVSCSLYQGTRSTFVGRLSDTEAYRKMRLGQLKRKLKALGLEARKRKLEID